ncbi:hypothetical protein [uncultured Cellulomonas sp.]|uniref:AbiTii domain-containing protein n=1 Tax=uncultured Cellulomonas sp. TaxID=189682 RepID=UPI0028E75902|nr:hypothetical protein [uncultured Cellulomonas sp.]
MYKSRHGNPIRKLQKRALNDSNSLTALLREVLVLGGQTGSQELVDWARRELDGYGRDDSLPGYRRVSVPLLMDGVTHNAHVKGQALAPFRLPDFARDHVTNELDLRMSISEIEHLAKVTPRGDVVRLAPPGADDLVVYMNDMGNWNGHVERIYWAASPVVFIGIVEGVRTSLVSLTAQMELIKAPDAIVPSSEATSDSVSVVIYGDRSKIKNLTINNADRGSSITNTGAGASPPSPYRRWAVIGGGLLAVVTAVFTLMQVQGWAF